MPNDGLALGLWSRALLCAACVFVVDGAHATSVMQSEIPNVPMACNTCHSDGGGSLLNAFGLDAWATRDKSADAPVVVRWDEIWNIDSDGDGQTNGMELGDPCGEWQSGLAAPRIVDISDPSDESSSTDDPLSGCSEGNEPPENADPRPEQPSVLDITQTTNTNPITMFTGGCFGNQLSSSGAISDLAPLALLALGLFSRRRRRDGSVFARFAV